MKRIFLRFVHGLGDAVQFTVVLKHLARKRPDWSIHARAGRGKHTAFLGLCAEVSHDQEPDPPGPFHTEATLGWYENYTGYPDRPNSKVTNCLAEVFGLTWDADLGSYEVRLAAANRQKAADYYRSLGARELGPEKFGVVVLHYEGNTSPWKKNLKHWQARSIVDFVRRAGRVPVILDWDGRSPLPDQKTVFCPAVGPQDLWGQYGSGDAGVIAALVHCAEAFVGIDSGPGKCASATRSPVLLCWREHHPIQFHDPNPTTVHLLPVDWRRLPPCEKPGVAEFFLEHYAYTTYHGGEQGLVYEVRQWLAKTLSFPDTGAVDTIPFVLPRGIGDTAWALLKIRAIAGPDPIDIVLGGGSVNAEVERRTLPFLKRFPFIRTVELLDLPILETPANDAQGRYRYLPDGLRGTFHYLMPNRVLERGERIETWLPEYPTDWSVIEQFSWEGTERGEELAEALSPFVAFYLGPETGNVDEGHNRGFLWEPKHWAALATRVAQAGQTLVLVGASYDRSYYERYCQDGFREAGLEPVDLIGKLEIGETFRLLKRCTFQVAYQSGIAIFGQYLGVRTVSWWRPEGNSIHPERLVSFSERMKDAWVRPEYADRWLGLVYSRETPGDIFGMIQERGWLGESPGVP